MSLFSYRSKAWFVCICDDKVLRSYFNLVLESLQPSHTIITTRGKNMLQWKRVKCLDHYNDFELRSQEHEQTNLMWSHDLYFSWYEYGGIRQSLIDASHHRSNLNICNTSQSQTPFALSSVTYTQRRKHRHQHSSIVTRARHHPFHPSISNILHNIEVVFDYDDLRLSKLDTLSSVPSVAWADEPSWFGMRRCADDRDAASICFFVCWCMVRE